MADALVTCIVLKPHVTLMDIVSTKMLGQFGFLVCEGQLFTLILSYMGILCWSD